MLMSEAIKSQQPRQEHIKKIKKQKKIPKLIIPSQLEENDTHINQLGYQYTLNIDEYKNQRYFAKTLKLQEMEKENTYISQQESTVLSIKGGRQEQLDTFICNDENQFYAVFDGHQSKDVSKILQNYCYQIYQELKQSQSKEFALVDTLNQIEEIILRSEQINGGSTALVCNINDRKISIANIGDCQIAIINDNLEIETLNQIHNLNYNKSEKLYLQEQGAYIINNRLQGRIELSRFIGGSCFKQTQQYNFKGPEHFTYEIKNQDKIMALASDGFWDIISPSKLQKLLKDYLQQFPQNKNNTKKITDFLIQQAIYQTTQFTQLDNITLIIVNLQKP